QHAHQKGLIHRDLKPSNILVGRQDGKIVAKVIDFGIAKATDVELADEVVETRIGQILGTPQYMSPEQAELSATDIDTRTDIYSLGVVLYELLTGVWPLDLQTSTVHTIAQMIRETQPVRPSRRIDSGDLDLDWISQTRNTVPSALKKDLHSDLDWITMKALAKERERRYQTVAEFAADIRNYLDRRPVVARPPSRSYLVTRFVQRNRLAVGAAAASVAALVFGAVVASIGLIRALEAEQLARDEAERAEQRTEQAENLLGFMVGDLRDSLEPLGRLDLMEDVGAEAMAYFSTVDLSTLTDSELLRQVQVMTQLGQIRMSQLQYDEAVASFTEAYDRVVVLYSKVPSDGDRLFSRGQTEFWIGFTHWRRGSLDDAETWLASYLETSLALSQLDPTRMDWLQEVGYAYQNIGVLRAERDQLEAAERDLRYALTTYEQVQAAADTPQIRSDISDVISWLGNIAKVRGEMSNMLNFYERSEALARSVWEKDIRNATWQQWLVFAQLRLADANSIVGNRRAAVDIADEALALSMELRDRDPSNTDLVVDIAKAHRIKGFALLAMGDRAAARDEADLLTANLDLVTRVAADDFELMESLAAANLLGAWIALDSDDLATALRLSQVAVDTMSQSLQADRLDNIGSSTLAGAWLTQAQTYSALDDPESVRQSLDATQNFLEERVGDSRSPYLLEPWIRLLFLSGRPTEADAARQALESSGFRPLRPWPEGSLL
ncbi:MAG: serine/threonine-protein kinase, partial [Gammaproteobacteria bacterium]